jgi:hypothetical protein
MISQEAIAGLFGRVFGGIPAAYQPGTLTRVTLVRQNDGSNARTIATHAVKVQTDDCTERMRRAEGYTSEDVRLLILTDGVDVETITSDDEITTADGRKWSCHDVRTDPARSHWECRGVRKRGT